LYSSYINIFIVIGTWYFTIMVPVENLICQLYAEKSAKL
jgi:hypothetical protein